MDILNKVLFLKEHTNLDDGKFCRKFKIKRKTFKSWISGEKTPTFFEVYKLSTSFNLDPFDFMVSESTLTTPVDGEHKCKVVNLNFNEYSLFEDFEKEDNSRYEEKD